MSSILACHPQRPLREEADSKEENEMFNDNDNRFAATNRGCISATNRRMHIRHKSGCGLPQFGVMSAANLRCRVLPRVRPPAYPRRKSGCKSATNRVAVLHEVRPYIGD